LNPRTHISDGYYCAGAARSEGMGRERYNAPSAHRIGGCNASFVMFITEIVTRGAMTKAKTGSFYLTETVGLTAAAADGSRFSDTMDLGAYVNVPTGQAIAVESVDAVWQNGSNYDGNIENMLAANGSLSFQLTDLNPGTAFVRADDLSLIASGSLNIDVANSIGTHTSDLYPDNHGPASLSEAFLVVNDQLYLVAGNDGAAVGSATVYCTVRVKCRVVKLSTKDWMAIAIQSTAADN
jgi:hypothetical protein